MKNKLLLFFLFAFFIFCFFIFYKSVNTDSSYQPNENLEKKINNFIAEDFFSGDKIESQELFKNNKFYIVNIWAAWCKPCREEHPKLMELSKNQNVQLYQMIVYNISLNPKILLEYLKLSHLLLDYQMYPEIF